MDMPALHFLFPFEEEFSRLLPFYESCKARQEADNLFAFSWLVQCAQVCGLSSSPAGLIGFLSKPSTVRRGTLTTMGAHRELVKGCVRAGKHVEFWRSLWATGGDLQER